MTVRFTRVLAAALLLSFGCDEETTGTDSGPSGTDSGMMVDSGGGTDSGPGDDAGGGTDSGPGDDAGSGDDAGMMSCVGGAAAQAHCTRYEMVCGFARPGLFTSGDDCRCTYDSWDTTRQICAANAVGRAGSDPDGECANATGMGMCSG